MANTCGDDRFELIAMARKKLIDGTNISDRPYEMDALDSILFRCWQMGWLDQLRDGAPMTDTEKAALERRIDELCAKIEQGKAENAKLVDVLHEVEQEAIYAYNCLQQDCEAMVGGQTHFFNKWWHAECECDRAKSQNAKLTNLAKWMYQVMDMSCAVRYPHEPAPVSIQALNRAEKELQALGIEVTS